MSLKIDYCSYKAAKYSVTHWHYSKCLPAGKLFKLGVWEDNKFIGCIIFSRGANNNLLKPYSLKMTEGCELTRIALDKHKTNVSKIISIALKILSKDNPGIKLVISFADERQKHLGTVYQASNWIYTGKIKSTPEYFLNGRYVHQRTVNSLRGTVKGLTIKRDGGFRFRYLYPLTKEMRERILKLQKSYPKSLCVSSVIGSTDSFQESGKVQIHSDAQVPNKQEIAEL